MVVKIILKQLSIIVPMYNVESYVERCLRSLGNQDIPKNEYEIICINDGSPDNSREVVIGLQKEFENIVLIDQDNQGVSRARNKGIDRSNGKYLLMVDPDDFVKPNILKRCLSLLDYYNLDVGMTGFIILNEGGDEEYRYDPEYAENNVLTAIDYYRNYLWGRSEIRDPHRSWAIFFRTSFLNSNNLRYLPDVPYLEDGEFIVRIRCFATRVTFINDPFYMRTTRPGSATHSNLISSVKARNGFLYAANSLLRFKNDKDRSNDQRVFLNQPIVHFTFLYLTSIGVFRYFKNINQLKKDLKKGPLRILETEGCTDYYKRIAICYNRSIHLFYLFWVIHRVSKSIRIRGNSFAKTVKIKLGFSSSS